MKDNGSNHFYRVIWNASLCVWQAVSEIGKAHGKTKNRKAEKLSLAAGALMLVGAHAYAADLPTNGNIVAGSGSISQSGTTMTITQDTARMAADWQSFSIGQGHTVNFVQPSASAVALNRVLGSDVSVIQGSLTANGQVFLINPNGVTFTPTAQVNVGGIVASTLNLSTADFMAGNYKFEGASSNAIVNQGNITAANGGTIALIAAKITNDGNLTANGGNVLLGAGSKVTLDLGGPVKLQVESSAIDALIKNGGAIRADGGTVLLTAKAAGDLAMTVINNTGIIEARTLSTGEKGEIYLLGDMVNDLIVVGGTLDASAPSGGDGGFIETSAANVQIQDGVHVTAASRDGKGGKWLIDPTDITISAASCTGTNCIAANTIASTLNGGTNVSIATSATNTGTERGDINFNADLAWNQSILTLTAHNDIWFRGNLTGTGTAKLALEYGLNGSGTASYTTLGTLSLPANSFSAKNGSSGSPAWINVPAFLNNGALRFGDGTVNSVDAFGSLRQPFYYNGTDKRWYKLTISTNPMDMNIGFGGTGYADGTIIDNQPIFAGGGKWTGRSFDRVSYFLSPSLNVSGFSNGVGTLISRNTVSDGGVTLTITNTYTLRAGTSYIEAITEVANSGTGAVDNVRLWSGTHDDWIGAPTAPAYCTGDCSVKTKGNLVNGVFVPVTATGQTANVIQVTNNNEGILFFSTSTGADTTIGRCCSPNFHIDSIGTGSALAHPSDTPYVTGIIDGNYSVYSNFGSLATSANKSIVWYYAAGDVASLGNIVSNVAQAAVVAVANLPGAAPAPAPAPAPASTPVSQSVAVESAQHTAANTVGIPIHLPLQTTPQPTATPSGVGGLEIIELHTAENETSKGGSADPVWAQVGGEHGVSGYSHVFVVNGGIRLPTVVQSEE